MSEHIKATIADLQAKLREQEAAALKTKALINQLCEVAGMPPMFADSDLEASSSHSLSIQSDQFYGQPLASCIRQILEMRRASNQGPATVNDIYDTLVHGGFAFDTKNVDNAKRGLRISLTKNTALFHKLPNGKFGMLDWYPNAKNKKSRIQIGGLVDTVGNETETEGEEDLHDGNISEEGEP